MRSSWMAAWLLWPAVASAQGVNPPSALTLEQALRRAEEANPGLQATQAGRLAARGEELEASALFHRNPELTLGATRRRAPGLDGSDTTFSESAITLSQSLELGGQPGYRRAAANHSSQAVEAEVADAWVRLRAEVELAFDKVLLLQRRLDAIRRTAAVVDQAATAVGKRVSEGEDSRLDGNLASVEAGRIHAEVQAVEEQLTAARANLATLLQLPPSEVPEVLGDLSKDLPRYRLEDLLTRAAARPGLAALGAREAAAQSRLELERAARVPDLTVGLGATREGPPGLRENAATLTFSLPLPLFQHNDAAIGRAMTERDRAVIERRAATRDSEARVRAQWERTRSLEARLGRLRDAVLPKLEQNELLSTKAYDAGEIGVVQLLLVTRQVLDARRDYLDALGDFTEARIALELAAGLHAPTSSPEK